tara:strand:- start:192 stop:431 length:240 start_codon:yes stop_codon:yes gene_type:complete
MGEAKRRIEKGLPPRNSSLKKDKSKKIFSWLSITEEQRDQFFLITQKGAWIGIVILIIFWVTVRFIGPMFGWWTTVDTH